MGGDSGLIESRIPEAKVEFPEVQAGSKGGDDRWAGSGGHVVGLKGHGEGLWVKKRNGEEGDGF